MSQVSYLCKELKEYKRYSKKLLEAVKEAQHYILTRKGKEFTLRDSDFFHISVVLAEATRPLRGTQWPTS
jgi:hypothetical protein